MNITKFAHQPLVNEKQLEYASIREIFEEVLILQRYLGFQNATTYR